MLPIRFVVPLSLLLPLILIPAPALFAQTTTKDAPAPIRTAGAKYDPLRKPARALPEPLEFTLKDVGRSRDIPILVYRPLDSAPTPVVLFSHGLGGSRHNNSYLGTHWAGVGYVAVFLQHPGSDTSAWQSAPIGQKLNELKQAASLQNFTARVRDVPAVLDQLEKWNQEPGHALHGRMNLKQVGMSGHSFGAVTTQAVSGQTFPLGADFTDPRIQAAIAFSPSSPRGRLDLSKSFGSVKIPWLLMTGANDVSIINDTDVESRLAVYPALPPGSKYELLLDGAEHSAFSERSLPGEKGKRNPNHHRAILSLSTAFWDAYLRNDAAARAWLDGDGARSVLEPADRWQHK
jgi:predicted dienelactone hydrolase